MYMNAITVNYAEVGDDHLPKSFGLVRNSDLDNQTVYNSNTIKITGTNYSILQSRDIGTKDIIVSSNPKIDRLLSTFTPGATGWIQHRIPGSDKTAYIFYKNDGYYYKMVEDENGRPVQAKYAPYAHLTNVKDNAGIQPYCEAEIETPVELQIAGNSIKAITDSGPVEIAGTSAELTLQLENADNNNFVSEPVPEPEYLIGGYFNPENTEWTRDGKSVPSWLSGNKIVKSSETVVGNVHYVKVLTGNNTVKIFRKRSDITAKFNFTNPEIQSFEDGGASSNGAEDSYMSGNSLIIPRVKHGKPQINLLDFFNNAQAGWFSPSATLNGPISEQTTFNIGVKIPTPTDTLIFTGWLNGHLVQNESIDITHKRLPQTITVSGINTNELKSITTKSDLLVHAGGNKFTRSGDFSSQTFTATAHYTKIPAVVSVTNPSATAVASNNQVVLFENTYYVADTNMKSLVESLVSGVTVTAQKEIVKNVAWQATILQTYYKMSTTKDGISVTYTPKFADITISGISNNVTSVESSDSNLTSQLTNQALSGTDISITIHYTVPDGYSLLNTGHQPSLDAPSTIPATDWNKTVTYKFFN